MNRRSFCKKAALGLAGGSILGTAAPARAADHDGTVSTRGHFDVTWWNAVYLTPGHTREGYDTETAIPGLDGGDPGEVVVFAHGWLVNDWSADVNFSYLDDTLAANGYTHPVVGFEWDADEAVAVDDWYPGVEIARRNGTKLAAFLRDLRAASPGTTVRLVGHSLGAQVVLSAVERLAAAGRPDVVDSLTLLGAAVGDAAPTVGGEFGPAVAAAAGETDNFHSVNDGTLATGFTGAEFDAALGTVGADGPTPDDYEDHAVPSVTNHLAYFLEGAGCLDLVAAEWREDAGDGDGSGGGDDGSGGGEDGSAVTRTRTLTGELSGAGDAATHTYGTRTADPREVVLDLSGAGEDFDLYVTRDGRAPTTGDHDERSRTHGSDERVAVSGVAPGATLGILVDSYEGAGEYELSVTETGVA